MPDLNAFVSTLIEKVVESSENLVEGKLSSLQFWHDICSLINLVDLIVQDSPILEATILGSTARCAYDCDGYVLEVDVFNKLPLCKRTHQFQGSH